MNKIGRRAYHSTEAKAEYLLPSAVLDRTYQPQVTGRRHGRERHAALPRREPHHPRRRKTPRLRAHGASHPAVQSRRTAPRGRGTLDTSSPYSESSAHLPDHQLSEIA